MELNVNGAQATYIQQEQFSTANKAPKTSGSRLSNNSIDAVSNYQQSGTSAIEAANETGDAGKVQQKIPTAYETRQTKMALEADLDKLIKQIMPDLGVKFKVHDSGQVITSIVNNDSKEVVREFPAEKILDIIYDMCTKVGVVVNKKV